ncbi:MAG: type II secretion system protein GspG [Verrucomicrobiales bacterium]|nr:type II secretion system protein GspG [Verrucomicrobiales bacterium]
MEMMLVLGIISVLIGLAAFSLRGVGNDAKVQKARAGLNAISINLKRFETYSGGLMPTDLNGLITKPASMQGKPWKAFARENELIDPWGTKYIYHNPGKNEVTGYDLFSAGPDKKEGTEDDIWFDQ